MKTIDLTPVYQKYKGKWVVFGRGNKVISADKDLNRAIAKFKIKNPRSIPDVFKVPTKLTPYIGVK